MLEDKIKGMNSLLFQYCQKIILFSADKTAVLLARRYGEADYDGTFSFIGGKMETTDKTIVAGLKREKDEEIGSQAKISICPTISLNVLFRKKDGNSMILPHYIAEYVDGDIQLNTDEYSEFAWVRLDELEALEPKIENIPTAVAWAQRQRAILRSEDFVAI